MNQLLKQASFFWHLLLSKSEIASKIYLYIISLIIKPLPAQLIKQKILNSINSVEWKNINLAPQIVQIDHDIIFKIIPHFREFDSEALLSKNISYEQEVFAYLKDHISEYDAIIEIGANIGIFSLFFYKSFIQYQKKLDKIFIFEPSKEAYFRLLKNLHINQATQIQTFNCAVGNQIGFLNFFEPEGHLTNGSLNYEFAHIFANKITKNKALVINGNYLSTLVSDSDNILIKIDTEGSEFEVLQGLKDLIISKKPTLIVEILSTYQEKLNQLDFLMDNYLLFNITSSGLVSHNQFESTQFRDYILLPKT